MTVIQEKYHATKSPSAGSRWMTCAGSVNLITQLLRTRKVVEKPSKFAAEGTVAHEVHELCLVKKRKAAYYIGRTFTADGFKFKVTKEMADAVQMSLDHIEETIFEAEYEGLRVELRVEVKCCLKSLNVPGMEGGTSDVVLLFWNGDELVRVEVFDYKHGAGVSVDAIDNVQAMQYALGTILIPELTHHAIPQGIDITISQPRAHHPDGLIRTWNISVDDLETWALDVLVPAGLACDEDDAPLVPSDKGCRFCLAASECPALFKRTQETAMIDFEDITDKPVMPDIKTLSSEQKKFIMLHGAMIRGFIVAVEKQVKDEVDLGSNDYQDAFKLVRKTTHRKFNEDVLDEITSPLYQYLPDDEIFETKPLALGKIEKSLKARVGKADAKDIIDSLTNKPTGDLVIAPLTDKRRAQEASITSDFKDI